MKTGLVKPDSEMDNLRRNLKYLQYFHKEVISALGPAEYDIYLELEKNYDGIVPEKYKRENFHGYKK